MKKELTPRQIANHARFKAMPPAMIVSPLKLIKRCAKDGLIGPSILRDAVKEAKAGRGHSVRMIAKFVLKDARP